MEAAKKHCKNKDITLDGNDLQTEHVLLPGLPNHLASLCLANLPPSLLYRVCISWRRFIYSPNFPPFYSLYALLAPTSPAPGSACQYHSASFFCFDPVAWKWRSLPSPPTSCSPLCMLSRHPSYISRILPVQSITASSLLLLIAANTHNFLPALSHPLVFNPLSSKWSFGPPFTSPRRWCVAGSMGSSVYVASGTGAQYQRDVARSLERWDMSKKEAEWMWETRTACKDAKLSREAIEAIGYRGKLCMVNIKGRALKEGAVYNISMNKWEQMPRGMLEGWTGPATTDDQFMYVVDQETGSLSKYDYENDCWEEFVGPSNHLKGAQHISAGRGKVCAVSADGSKIFVVDVSASAIARPPKFWTLEPPDGMEVIAVHILPRMSMHQSSC
ncbi:F-box/kelch-repeat protein SKIP25-like [Salvia hispanica]|uniref:F-box/kelch-repeat protein SKIP25-like n=1 Tax=Salvia hispanica TaxID=49212 RepID=UPI002009747B|nr:F-box/kelch-repeat protein SKIP25-like [Salvia hispanica]